MSTLEKAKLQEISEADVPQGEPIPVQFNPTTLKIQINNSIEGGESRGRQVRQYIGSSSTTLSLDLIFDTADEGTTAAPRSVLEKTAQVEKFLLPKSEGKNKQVPPRLRFQWGRLIVDGIVDALTIDLDLFAADGTPLRAKVSLAIKEQNRKFQLLESGPGANRGGNAPAPGQPTAGAPGSSGGGLQAQAGFALGGESAADFAARVGLDPSAWRGLSLGGSSSLSLEAGLEVGFSADLSASAGLGVTLGVEAGVSVSLEASFGLEASAGVSAVAGVGVGGDLAAGFALSAAGGVSAAVESVHIARSQAAEQQQRVAFAAPPAPAATAAAGLAVGAAAATTGPGAPTRPAPPEQPHVPLTQSGLPSPAEQQAAPPAPPPPRADPRSVSFGFGVPLRTTVGQAADLRSGLMQGGLALRPHTGTGEPPLTSNPTVPPWVSLPAAEASQGPAVKCRRRRGCSCSCAGPCHH